MGWFTPWRWVFTSWRLVPNVDFKPNKTSTLWSFTTFPLPDLQRWGPPYNYKRSIWFHPRPYKWRNIIHETTGVVVTLWSFLWLYISDPLIQLGKATTGPPWLAQKPKTRNRNQPFFPKGKADENWKHRANSRRPPAVKDDVFCVPWWASHRIASHRFASFRTRGRETRWSNVFGFYFFFGGGWWVQKKSKQTEQARIWLEVKFLQNEGVCEVFSCYY